MVNADNGNVINVFGKTAPQQPIAGYAGEQLPDTGSIRSYPCIRGLDIDISHASDELANTKSSECQHVPGEHTPQQPIAGYAGEQLPDTGSIRSGKNSNRGRAEQLNTNGQKGRINQFPAPRGYEQYEWEAPRVVEPGMGCTVNGYNFRIDLLRAYGNSVVEQTAELAFITLLQLHANNQPKKD
jgi:hypothetical protein